MRRHLLLFSSLLATSLFAQSSPNGSGIVSGQVVQGLTGAPVAKVSVSLVPMDGNAGISLRFRQAFALSAVTDADGRFQFDQLAPNEYRVFIRKSGFVSAGRKSQQDSPTFITVADGQKVEGLLFRVLPAGVIRGKIVDEDGDPMPDVQVFALPASGRAIAGSGTTNDLGEYRISGLPAGKYLVLAHGGNATPNRRSNGDPSAVYTPTFFPGTMERAQAASLEVRDGDEVDAGFGLVVSRTFTIRGQLLRASTPRPRPGQDAETDLITLQRTDVQQGAPLYVSPEADGSFTLEGVLPGTYRVQGRTSNGDWWRPASGSDVIEVRSDVAGLRLAPEPPGVVRGHFRMDTGKQFNWSQLTITLVPDDEPSGGVPGAQVNKDGSFVMEGVPVGNYHAMVTADSNNLRDYFMKEVNVNGKEVGDSGFSVGPGVSNLEVVASANGSAIVGTLVDGDRKTVTGIQVVCIPDETRRKRQDVYQQDRTNARGEFSFLGLNPGEYLVFPLNSEDPADITDPDFIREHEASAQRVKVEEGEHKTVTLNFSWDNTQ